MNHILYILIIYATETHIIALSLERVYLRSYGKFEMHLRHTM